MNAKEIGNMSEIQPLLTEQTHLPKKVKLAVTALIIGGIAAILDSTMITLAINTLATDFSESTGTIQWVTTAYLLSMAVAIPTTGWAEAHWGGKRSWIAALLIFVIGSALCATAWNAGSLIAFRVIQGFGGGLIYPLMQTLAVRAAGQKPTPSLMATISVPIAIGPILGPVLAGIILNWLNWRWLFLVNVPIIAVGLICAFLFLPGDHADKQMHDQRLDLFGLILLAPGLTGILLALSNISKNGGVDHADVIWPGVIGIVLFLGFIFWALHKGNHAIVDVKLLRFRSLASADCVLFIAGATMYAAMFLLPLYYQNLRGKSVLDAGLLMIPQGVGALLSRFITSSLVRKFGARNFTVLAFVVAAAATMPFALADASTSLWWLGAVVFVRGLGIGAMLIPAMSIAYSDVPESGVQHATMQTRIVQQVGASFGTAIASVVMQHYLTQGPVSSFQYAFWWTCGIACVGAVLSFTLPRARAHH